MIALLDTSHDLDQCAEELGCDIGQLLTPKRRQPLRNPNDYWAVDNGGYSTLDIKGFLSLLRSLNDYQDKCLFVAVPDIVASARRTLELFEHWAPLLTGWPLALVAQDGQENLPIPWSRIESIFVGGSTKWKCSIHAEQIVRTAKALDKWVHIGRINTRDRFEHFAKIGADSFDGTGLAKYSHMRLAFKTLETKLL